MLLLMIKVKDCKVKSSVYGRRYVSNDDRSVTAVLFVRPPPDDQSVTVELAV